MGHENRLVIKTVISICNLIIYLVNLSDQVYLFDDWMHLRDSFENLGS